MPNDNKVIPKGYWREYDEETCQEALACPPGALEHFPPLPGMKLIRIKDEGERSALCYFTFPEED